MKVRKGLIGLAAGIALVVGSSSAWAEFGTVAKAQLDLENAPEVVSTAGPSAPWDRQDRAPGSVAQEMLDLNDGGD